MPKLVWHDAHDSDAKLRGVTWVKLLLLLLLLPFFFAGRRILHRVRADPFKPEEKLFYFISESVVMTLQFFILVYSNNIFNYRQFTKSHVPLTEQIP